VHPVNEWDATTADREAEHREGWRPVTDDGVKVLRCEERVQALIGLPKVPWLAHPGGTEESQFGALFG
jgi:hypothetical protein